MQTSQLKTVLEALIFAAEEPLSLLALAGLVEDLGAGRAEVQEAVGELLNDYREGSGRGIFLREVAGGFQFATSPETAQWVARLNAARPKTLSQAALETLSIIAYRQPIVRSEIEAIRGVDTGGVLKTLLERGLLRILGRREEAGQPLIYGTTPAFLELFHLKSLEELPSMREIEQLVEGPNAAPQVPEDEGEAVAAAEEEGESFPAGEEFLPVEAGEEGKALEDLESSLKDLRKVEKEIFPKEEAAPAGEEGAAPTTADPTESPEEIPQ